MPEFSVAHPGDIARIAMIGRSLIVHASHHGLPNETLAERCEGFDEWYVFASSPSRRDGSVCELGRLSPIPSRVELVRRPPLAATDPSQRGDLRGSEDVFTFATHNSELFDKVLRAF